jgi:excisionase family DNA binding protein
VSNDSLTITIPEAAKALGISRGLAYSLARRNELPVKVIRIGDKRMVVSRRALDNLLFDKYVEMVRNGQSDKSFQRCQ